MKKTLIAAAVMAASGVAFAASNVTLYGVVDTSAVFTHDGGATDSKNVIDMQSGFRNGSRRYPKNSGHSDCNRNRLGK